MPLGYKPRMCYFGIFGWPQFGPAYLGIPGEACVVEGKEAAAIFARWKGSYRLVPVAPGPEMGGPASLARDGWASLASFTDVYISDEGMCFSGGTHLEKQRGYKSSSNMSCITISVENQPFTHKLALRRVADGKPYLDNFGSRILEDSPAELKIRLYQGGTIVLTKAK